VHAVPVRRGGSAATCERLLCLAHYQPAAVISYVVSLAVSLLTVISYVVDCCLAVS
jgi:hypothetical protein